MTAYAAILSARLRTLLQYRTAALAGLCTQLFWGLIRVMIFEAFYRSSNAPQPMPYRDVVTYVWLGQALFAMLPYTANPDPDVRNMIRSGSVAYELARPLDLYTLWYVRSLAGRVAPTMLRSAPLATCALLFFGMRLPPSAQSAVAWAISTAGALLLISAFMTLLTISLLWTISGDGITRIAPSLVFVFSGMIVPLPLYPVWAQGALDFLPFRGMVDAPFRLYMGHIAASQVGLVVAHQLAWAAVFVLLGRWLLARGMRRLVVQGG
jgi:ABC-2 type transport system permease protein